MGMNIKILFKLVMLLLLVGFASVSHAVILNENCVINVLNRTVQVQPNGTWALPNVPSSMGQVRARATCIQNGVTYVGETDYFALVANTSIKVGPVNFGAIESVPKKISYSTISYAFTVIGATQLMAVQAIYADNSVADVTAATSGINYVSSNPAIVTVSPNGLLTAVANGTAIITARKDGAVAVATVRVAVAGGDADGDGIPDDFEIANGLNPNDPVDAAEDQDGDGLTALQEYNLGTDIFVADSDGDGISDGVEVAGSNGFATNPLLFDSDGDGISDGLEIQTLSDPNNAASYNLAAALASIDVTPATAVIVFNTIDAEATKQLVVTGNLTDGTTIDLTARSKGTNYAPTNLSVVSLGVEDGLLFAGLAGTTQVTVTNNGFQAAVSITVTTFAPAALSSVTIPGYANNVDVYGNYAFVAAGAAGLQVVDAGNPNAPIIIGSLDTYGNAIDVRVEGTYAYIADGVNGVVVADISNPLLPTLVATVDTYGIAQDLSLLNGYIYVADGADGLKVIDARVPTQPSLVGSLTGLGNAVGVGVSGTTVVLGADNYARAIDVSNPTVPVLSGSVVVGSIKDLVVRDAYAYTAAYTSGYHVIDISNPALPVIVGSGVGTSPGGFVSRDVELIGNKAFYAEQLFPNAIPYVNVSNPSTPLFQGTINLAPLGDYAGTGIAVTDKFVYVTEQSFFVGTNYGTTGNTRLFIAQYRAILDEGTVAPTVSLTSPIGTATFTQGQTITLQATAFDDVAVAAVNFYVNGVLVGTSTNGPPYTLAYTIPLNATGLTFSATAVDYASNVGTTVDIPVANIQPYLGPVIAMTSPVSGTSLVEGDTIVFSATASDPIGTVTTVELFVEGALVGNATAVPYDFPNTLPIDITALNAEMIATASTGVASSAGIQNYPIILDPLTTVIGSVIDEYGTAAVGAAVKVQLPDVPVELGTATINAGALVADPYTTIATSSMAGSVNFDAAIQPLLGEAVNLANNEVVSLTGAVALDMLGYNPLAPTTRTGTIDLYATAPSGLDMVMHGALVNFLPTAGVHTVDTILNVTAFTAGTNLTALPLTGQIMTVRVQGTVNVVTDPATSNVTSMTWNVSLGQTVLLDYSTTAAIDGSFSILGVPTIFGDVIVDAIVPATALKLEELGSSLATPYVRGGLTDVGIIQTTSLYRFSGIVQNLPVASLSGWTQCFSAPYGNRNAYSGNMQAACTGSKIMLACRATGSSTLQLAAYANRSEVFLDTGVGGNTVHTANGVDWYYSPNYSMGFVPVGAGVRRNSADILSTFNNQRLSWHTHSWHPQGYRCGATRTNSSMTLEKVIFQAN